MPLADNDLENLKIALKHNVMRVTFTKADGQKRVMLCTLDPSRLPPDDGSKRLRDWVPNPSVLPVYDVEVEGWRSFRVDSIISYNLADPTAR